MQSRHAVSMLSEKSGVFAVLSGVLSMVFLDRLGGELVCWDALGCPHGTGHQCCAFLCADCWPAQIRGAQDSKDGPACDIVSTRALHRVEPCLPRAGFLRRGSVSTAAAREQERIWTGDCTCSYSGPASKFVYELAPACCGCCPLWNEKLEFCRTRM